MKQPSVLLIAMPWNRYDLPSIQLATLQAYLQKKGIKAETKHYYLKLADRLGVEMYYELASSTFYASILYSELLFGHQKRYLDFIRDEAEGSYFSKKEIDPEKVIQQITEFHEEVLEDINPEAYDIIGFSLGYQQEVPSLALAKAIKAVSPDTRIVFGGSSCYAEMGKSLLNNFPYIDFIISGEGEEALYELIHQIVCGEPLSSIRGLYYRDQKEVVENQRRPLIKDLNALPYPTYDDYFNQFNACRRLQEYSIYNVVHIPLEGSRGCWWNKCGYCGLNMQFVDERKIFRAKTPERVAGEVAHQTEKYRIGYLSFTDNTQFQVTKLCDQLARERADFKFFLEIRANLTPRDVFLMKEAGFTDVQVGVESFSQGILKKMNKGVRVIENISVLKWCKFFGLKTNYNIIMNFPMESPKEIAEQLEVAKKIFHLPPPLQVIQFILVYDSPVYRNPEKYRIGEIRPTKFYKYIYPEETLSRLTVMLYDFEHLEPLGTKEMWTEFNLLVDHWKSKSSASLTYQDGGSFLKIVDERSEDQVTGILQEREREIYLYCNQIRSKEEILGRFSHLNSEFVLDCLDTYINYGIMFEEDGDYLSLALPDGVKSIKRLMDEVVNEIR